MDYRNYIFCIFAFILAALLMGLAYWLFVIRAKRHRRSDSSTMLKLYELCQRMEETLERYEEASARALDVPRGMAEPVPPPPAPVSPAVTAAPAETVAAAEAVSTPETLSEGLSGAVQKMEAAVQAAYAEQAPQEPVLKDEPAARPQAVSETPVRSVLKPAKKVEIEEDDDEDADELFSWEGDIPRAKASGRAIEKGSTREKVLQLARSGLTIDEIAKNLDITSAEVELSIKY